ncbi:hypothetical protein [Paraburkholderia pallida]|uniref:Uncharacterized protein n=1 Tax=Paraburkholderia pallida TaxID=2547399 RepID=A0A4P7CZ03_9BURK|nr:hypothetical protein [Paraburkholderia pallida]QBR01536.1 hypothetical protein E1956_30620 [Paraburkholderia pallida]
MKRFVDALWRRWRDKSFAEVLRVWLRQYWIPILGVSALLLTIVLSLLTTRWFSTSLWDCLGESLYLLSPDGDACRVALGKMVSVTASGAAHTGSTATIQSLLVWVDNLLVDMYALFFLASAGAAYKRLTTVSTDPVVAWRAAISATTVLVLLGALAAHAENFWLLAKLTPQSDMASSKVGLDAVTRLAAYRYRFLLADLLVITAWWLAVLHREQRMKERKDTIVAILRDADEQRLVDLVQVQTLAALDSITLGSVPIGRCPARLWQGVFYYQFVYGVPTNGIFRRSFSRHAISEWKKLLWESDESETDEREKKIQMYKDEITRYLDYFAQIGMIAPNGGRYEVTWSTLPPPNRPAVAMDAEAPVDGDG